MKFTGERMIPEENRGKKIYFEHIVRYEFAKKFAPNKDVLDIACGSGYGSKILKDSGARSVVGVDISEESISYCKKVYNESNLYFKTGNVTKIPLKDSSVDVVVSFETLEHVSGDDQKQFLKEIKRVLRKDGALIISTPNTEVSPKGNEFHLKELSPEEFKVFLEDGFKYNSLFFQDYLGASYIFSNSKDQKNITSQEVDSIDDKKALFLIAISSNVALDVVDVNNSLAVSNIRLQDEFKAYEKRIAQKDKKLKEVFLSIKRMEQKISKVSKNIQSKDGELKRASRKLMKMEQRISMMQSSKFWQLRGLYLKTKPRVKFVIFSPKKFSLKILKKLTYLTKSFNTSLREEGIRVVLKRVFNYIRFGKGISINRDKNFELKSNFFSKKDAKREVELLIKKQKVKLSHKEDPLVSLIILNKNGKHHLERLFQSLKKNTVYSNYEVVLIDNGSTDNSIQYLENNEFGFPLNVKKNIENVSFSSGCNQGAMLARGELLLFLNNDIQVTKGWLSSLVDCYFNNKGCVGSIGAKLIYPSQKDFKFSNRIQHAGIKFGWDDQFSFFRPFNYGVGESVLDHCEQKQFPALTAALLLVPRSRFEEVGGFDEAYFYGYEDVDLGLKLLKLGYRNIYCPKAVAFHWELGTQESDKAEDIIDRRKGNIDIFSKKWDGFIKDEILRDSFASRNIYSNKKFTVSLVVTETGENARAGDYFTGLELAHELEKFGWRIKYQSYKGPGDWYKVDSDVDVLISLLDGYDISKIKTKNKNLIKTAWVRNWFDRWVDHIYFNDFDIVLSSSKAGVRYIKENTGKVSHVFPIAANINKFSIKKEVSGEFICDYVFSGHYWGHERKIIKQLDPNGLPYKFNIFGKDWDQVNSLKKFHRGCVDYSDMSSVYAGAKIVLDDAEFPTEPWGSVNSRVFDALASGKLVFTNGVVGAKETFNDKLPYFRNKEELSEKLRFYLENEDEMNKKIDELRSFVLEEHTYKKRAAEFCRILRKTLFERESVAIKIPIPNWKESESWGDYHFSVALRKYFKKNNWNSTVQILPEWENNELDRDCSMALTLRGLSRYKPKDSMINIMWNISHPDNVSIEEYNEYDHVFIASDFWTKKMERRLNTNVSTLLQCTDPDLFKVPTKEEISKNRRDIIFVGNSRRQFRTSVRYAIENGFDVDVFGNLWGDIIDNKYIKGLNIPNKDLYKHYGSAKLVLNDHWDDMAQKGFLSNRVFDVLATGSTILTDCVVDLDEDIERMLFVYKNKGDFKTKVRGILNDERRIGREFRMSRHQHIKSKHSFENRVEDMIKAFNKVAKKDS